MPIAKLREFLDTEHVKYTTMAHSLAYTSQELANITHISGRELAKTVIVKIEGEYAMLVLPACLHVDFEMLAAALNAGHVRLALEAEFKTKFPDCETGAMPPFGNLYGMKVYVDESLARAHDIAFAAGSHREIVRMEYADFARLVQPEVMHFSSMLVASA
ncbi:MAG: YbaK/EbsC family protein [Acidobacteria bacterium]|nr:YbaK/EbsC family protein [Acidobacteriota bacterium]